MRKVLVFFLAFSLVVFASDKEELKKIYQKFSSTFKNTKIRSIKESPVKGLYQVVLDNGEILYTDGKHLVIGHIFTFKGEDLTQKEIDEIAGKSIDKLDLSKAIKIGNGKQKVIEVSDPECPFCRRSERFFKNKDVTRYVYFMPLPFHKKARPLAIHILCSKDKEKEYRKAMRGKLDNAKQLIYCSEGEEKLRQMEGVAKKLKVRGTPVFWVQTKNGWKKIEGANPEILKYLKEK